MLDVGLHSMPSLALVVLKLARSCQKGVTQRHVGIFMSVALRMSVADCDFPTRYGDIDLDIKKIALVMMPVWQLDGDMAADDAGAESCKPLR